MPRACSAAPSWIAVTALASLLLGFSGCGDGKFPVRSAKGKVVCNGNPVTVGSITFSPLGDGTNPETGKPATAMVGADGTFVLTTFSRFDGAIVGKHSVQYVGPEGEDEEEVEESDVPENARAMAANNAKKIRERLAKRKTQCYQKGEIIVEVTDGGENDFTIELSPVGR